MISLDAKIAFLTEFGLEVATVCEFRWRIEDPSGVGEIFLYGGESVLDQAINIITCNGRITV